MNLINPINTSKHRELKLIMMEEYIRDAFVCVLMLFIYLQEIHASVITTHIPQFCHFVLWRFSTIISVAFFTKEFRINVSHGRWSNRELWPGLRCESFYMITRREEQRETDWASRRDMIINCNESRHRWNINGTAGETSVTDWSREKSRIPLDVIANTHPTFD